MTAAKLAEDLPSEIVKFLKPLVLEQSDYSEIRDVMLETMKRGLDIKTRKNASIKMYPSYVTSLPDGTGIRFFHAYFMV